MKILIICSNLIGDNVLSTGVFSHLKKKYPNAKFTFIIGPSAKPLLKNFPNLDKIISIKKKKYSLHWVNIFKETINEKWDIVIDLRSSLLSFFLKKRKKLIFKKKPKRHHVTQLNLSFGFDCSNLNVFTNGEENNEAKKNLNCNKNKYIVIFPGGNWKPKIWQVENYNKLILLLHKNNKTFKFILAGSKLEKEVYFNSITKNISKEYIVDLFGRSLTLTAAYFKKSYFFIGNDSGLMHLSSACNLPTIGLFGPTNDTIYSPWGKNNTIIRTKESYEYFKKISMNPNISYMNSIKTNTVYEKIKSLGLCD